MEKDNLTKNVYKLIQLDIDAVAAYEQAIKNIDEESVRKKLDSFKEDHQKHIKNLSHWMTQNGATPPESTGIKGFILEGFTAIASKVGLNQALQAMRQNENLTNKNYKESLKWKGDEKLTRQLEEGYDDEVKHLTYITSELKALEKKKEKEKD